jgi:hypothetical protein
MPPTPSLVDGETEAEFTANADGTASLVFTLEPTGSQYEFGFRSSWETTRGERWHG